MHYVVFLIVIVTPVEALSLFPLPNHISVKYKFPNVPLAHGIKHIHTPEHICEVHKVGAPCFQLSNVNKPKLNANSASVLYQCSTLFVKDMRVLMYTTRRTESNLLFIKNRVAMYNMKLRVVGDENEHTLKIDIAFYNGNDMFFKLVTTLFPLFVAINGAEDQRAFQHGAVMQENKNLAIYRDWVLRGMQSFIV
jgi:hypothetical protein